jgi:ferrous iron transport protein B
MSVASPSRIVTVALIGNPNTGKSTLFSALCGVRQRVGNYPGVTVEKKIGRTELHGRQFAIVDLPGTYSLAPKSPDEMVAVDVLLGRRDDVDSPDVVLVIVDASNLERNFYLLSQVLELGLPTVVAVNMVDVARRKGLTLDVERLRRQLHVPVALVQANLRIGIAELKSALADAVDCPPPQVASPFPEAFQEEVAALAGRAAASASDQSRPMPRYLVERMLLDVGGYLSKSPSAGVSPELLSEVTGARTRLQAAGVPIPAVEALSRYQWAGKVLSGVVQRPAERRVTLSDRIDRVLTHRVWGTLVFIVLMLAMFQAVYYVPDVTGANWGIDKLKGLLAGGVARIVPDGALRSLLVTGVIEGVGGVVVFLPQIFTLFLFIAILEDCGYMARAAYLMDKLMSRIGLSGKSFIPLLSSFACAVPGVMATRVIENRRDRLVTILVAPLMSCSARLPVYTLLIAAFVPDYALGSGWFRVSWLQGLVMFAMYMVGIAAAIAVAWILKRTLLRGDTPPFVMELPSYKLPGVWVVLHRMLEQGWSFVRRAGTLILAVSIIVWGLAYYPRNEARIDPALLSAEKQLSSDLAALEAQLPPGEEDSDSPLAKEHDEVQAKLQHVRNEIEGTHLSNSILGQMGHWIEPAVRPLGWDWRIGCAAIASFPAREVVVSTLGVIYNLGKGQEEDPTELAATLQNATWPGTDRKVITLPVALSIMVFFALCAQCASTLAVIRRETGSWRWPLFTFVYMTGLAYVGALVTYQVGTFLAGGMP